MPGFPAFFWNLYWRFIKNAHQILPLAAVLFFTAALFSILLKNGFINWDDPGYILENPLIRDLSLDGIIKIFGTLQLNGFLPVTQLSWAIDYYFWGVNPAGYHLTGLWLHLGNVALAYFLALQLTGQRNAALLTCLLFAVHPMRVESVAWVSERKDVLYAFFYLLSVMAYVKYLKSNFKIRFIVLCFVLFSLSVFSKWSACPLPFALLLVDFYMKRKIGAKAIIEKCIFLIVPVVSVFLHVSKGVVVADHFSFLNRIFLGSHSFVFYLAKFIFPVNLSAIYPYPVMSESGFLPLDYYLSVPAVLILGFAVFLLVKKFPEERDFILLCLGFFIINIGMVLHVLYPIGGVVVAADRYTYIPFFGLFLLAGVYAAKLYEKNRNNKRLKNLLFLLLLVVVSAWSLQTFVRIKLWKNSIVFFNAIIKKDPAIPFAWNNLGFAEADQGLHFQAISHYSKAIALNPGFTYSLNNRGLAYDATGQFDLALSDFDKAISIKDYDPVLFYNRGLTFYHKGDFQNAIEDYTLAIEKAPQESKYYVKRGAACNDIGNYSQALTDFQMAISLSPENAEAHNYLGVTYNYLNRLGESVASYDKAIALDPGYSSAYNNRGWVRFLMKNYSEALADFSKSTALDPGFSFPYHNRGMLYSELNDPEKACAEWNKALSLGYEPSGYMIEKNCNDRHPRP